MGIIKSFIGKILKKEKDPKLDEALDKKSIPNFTGTVKRSRERRP